MTFSATIQNLDLFKVPIGVTYKRQHYFKTVCGGIMGFLIVLIVAVTALIEFYLMTTDVQYKQLIQRY